ncbi:MAG TPA: zinc ribbon domain-containing protein [Candidatus Binatia bacterium]|nr:zinc ribbon domain-containing protein [Candidatus Binatia bacterium]
MPIYEYRCNQCRKKVSILTLRVTEKVDERCEHCGSTRLTRLLSRFATTRSEESRLDSLADPSNLSGLDESDPRSMARWMRKMGKEMGDEFGGAEFNEMIDEMEAGNMPDEGGGDLEAAKGGGEPPDD